MTKFILPNDVFLQHVAVLGKTGSGKSSAMRLMVEHLLDQKKPICVIDPKGDWWGIKSSGDGKSAGYEVVIFGGEHADVAIDERAGASVAELVATGNRPAIIDLGGWTVHARTRFFIQFAEMFFKLSRGQRWLCLDEVHNFVPKGKIMSPEAGLMLHWGNRLASEGRGKGINLIAASQRPQKVHNDFLTSCETLIAMRVIHPADRQAIADWLQGAGDAAKAKEVLDTLAQNARGEGWVWSPEIGFGPARVKFPMFNTFDSFAASANSGEVKLKGWASVDLDEVRAKLVTVIEEAKANDPAELKRKIADLQRQLKASAAKPVEVESRKTQQTILALRKGLEEAMKVIAKITASGFEKTSVDPEQIKKAIEAATDRIVKLVETDLTKKAAEFDKLKHDARQVLNKLAKLLETDTTVAVGIKQQDPFLVTLPKARARAQGGDEESDESEDAGGDLGGGALNRIMRVLAQYPEGVTPAKVAVLANIRKGGSTMRNSLSKGRKNGWIVGGIGDTLKATGDGVAALGKYEPLPTGAALRRYWQQELGEGAPRQIFDLVLQAYPGPIDKETIGEQTGIVVNGSTMRNALSRLRTLELISRDQIRASEFLFEE